MLTGACGLPPSRIASGGHLLLQGADIEAIVYATVALLKRPQRGPEAPPVAEGGGAPVIRAPPRAPSRRLITLRARVIRLRSHIPAYGNMAATLVPITSVPRVAISRCTRTKRRVALEGDKLTGKPAPTVGQVARRFVPLAPTVSAPKPRAPAIAQSLRETA